MDTQKFLLPVIIASSLFAVCYFESCLPDGDDTIIIDAPSKDTVIHQPIEPDPDPIEDSELQGKSGDLRFNLQWHTKEDLDLYAITPCGDTVCFYNRQVFCNDAVGTLDVDANFDVFSEHPQENIYWEKPSPGEYKVFVINFSYFHNSTNDVDFTLTIINHEERTDLKGQTDGMNFIFVSSILIEP